MVNGSHVDTRIIYDLTVVQVYFQVRAPRSESAIGPALP